MKLNMTESEIIEQFKIDYPFDEDAWIVFGSCKAGDNRDLLNSFLMWHRDGNLYDLDYAILLCFLRDIPVKGLLMEAFHELTKRRMLGREHQGVNTKRLKKQILNLAHTKASLLIYWCEMPVNEAYNLVANWLDSSGIAICGMKSSSLQKMSSKWRDENKRAFTAIKDSASHISKDSMSALIRSILEGTHTNKVKKR